MLVIAEEIRSVGDASEPDVPRRVDDDMLEAGVVLQTAWAWALYAAGLAAAVGMYFACTPR